MVRVVDVSEKNLHESCKYTIITVEEVKEEGEECTTIEIVRREL